MAFIVGERGHFKATQDLNDLESVARQFCDKGIDILALSGGDGTNHRTLTTFINVYGNKPLPRIALLRGGTLNTVAASCGIYGSPEKLLMNLIYHYHEATPFKSTKIRMLRVNDSYGFIWGCGVIFRFMDAYYRGGSPSPKQAALTLVRSIVSALLNLRFARDVFRRFDGEVTINGERWPYANYNAIYAGSIAQLGLNFNVFYLIDEQHPFHGVGFSLPPRNVLRYVPRMFLGKSSGCPDLLEAGGIDMVVRLGEAQSYTIDGDMYAPEDYFHIRPGPELDVIVP
jgi:diacylglycerol kinase family enzyme